MNSTVRGALIGAGVVAGVAGATLAAGALEARRFSWRGKVVLITGGSRGLGLVLARELVARGASVAICAREAVELARARSDLASRGRAGEGVFAIVGDVTSETAVRSTVSLVEARLGPIDVLINNAGVIAAGPASEMTTEDYEQAMSTHFWAPLFSMMAVLPGMERRGVGRVVNIASVGGKVAVPHLAPYCASKFALVGLGEALRQEYLSKGVSITTVCPGLMQTGSPVNAFFKGRHRAEYAWFALASSAPGLVMSPRRAVRTILRAAASGRAEVILGLPAKAAVLVHNLSPGLWMRMMAQLNRLLPRPGGLGTGLATGAQSESRLAPSILTRPVYRAAARNNEFPTVVSST